MSKALKQQRAYLYALTAVIFWSTIATAFKIGLQHLDVFQLLFIASLISTLFFSIVLIVNGTIKQVLTQTGLKSVWSSALLGFLNPFLYYVVLIHAYNMITAQEAMTLNYIWPMVLVLLSIPLLKQRIKPASFVAMFISFAGIFIIATKGDITGFRFSNLTGDLLAAGSSIAWALYWILNLKDHRTPSSKLFLNFLFGSIYATMALFIWSDFSGFSTIGLLSGIYLGLFEMGLTFLLWLSALRYSTKTHLVSQLVYIAPFIGLIWIWLILHEHIWWSTLIGLVLLITGIVAQQRIERTKK